MAKVGVVVRVSGNRPVNHIEEFWSEERDSFLFYYVSKHNNAQCFEDIAQYYGIATEECRKRYQKYQKSKDIPLNQVESKLNIQNNNNSLEESTKEVSFQEAQQLRELAEKLEYDWNLISRTFLGGAKTPLECRQLCNSFNSLQIPSSASLTSSNSRLDSSGEDYLLGESFSFF